MNEVMIMGKIKGWKKVKESKNMIIWEQDDPKTYMTKTKYNTMVGRPQYVEVKRVSPNSVQVMGSYWDSLFISWSSAKAYAIKWMKAHPRG